jgi:hypothetical protein
MFSISKILSEGNAAGLTRYMEQVLDKKNLRVAYFGGHALNDIAHTYSFSKQQPLAKWHVYAVVKEF